MENKHNPEEPKTLSTEQARQGETTGRMRTVLAVSLVLAVVAGIIFTLVL